MARAQPAHSQAQPVPQRTPHGQAGAAAANVPDGITGTERRQQYRNRLPFKRARAPGSARPIRRLRAGRSIPKHVRNRAARRPLCQRTNPLRPVPSTIPARAPLRHGLRGREARHALSRTKAGDVAAPTRQPADASETLRPFTQGAPRGRQAVSVRPRAFGTKRPVQHYSVLISTAQRHPAPFSITPRRSALLRAAPCCSTLLRDAQRPGPRLGLTPPRERTARAPPRPRRRGQC